MFQFYDITDRKRQELNIWADSVIEVNQELMSSGKAYLIWSDKLYYQIEKDTWADESWWIKTARKLFAEHKDDYDGMGTAVIPALEILVYYFPEEYRDFARAKIDRWFNESYHDPEYYWELIILAYPDHPVTRLLFEQPENSRELKIAIRLLDRQTIIQTKESILSEIEEGNISWAITDLAVFTKNIFAEFFSQSESQIIKAKTIEIAKQNLSINSNKHLDLYATLELAIIMEWQETIDALSSNVDYPAILMNSLKKCYPTEILSWSLTNKYKLTENLVFQLYSDLSYMKFDNKIFPCHEFALAIAWKRSQSKV
jgi:hypothetical protein